MVVGVSLFIAGAGAQGPETEVTDIRLSPDPAAAFAALPADDQQRIVADLQAEETYTVVTAQYSTPGPGDVTRFRLPGAAAAAHTFAAVRDSDFDIVQFSSSCATYKVTWWHFSSSNMLLNSYWSSTRWCWDGTYITNDPHFTRGGKAHQWPWFYRGHIDKSDSGGQGETEWEDFTEGEFESCPGSNCIAQKTPEITKVLYGNGSRSSSANG